MTNAYDNGPLYLRITRRIVPGLGKIYTEEEIENAKHSPSFGREYE